MVDNFVYIKNGKETQLIVNENGNVSLDERLFAKIKTENYGDYINYDIDLNDDGDTTNDWRIFYNDGENVFIIATGHLPNKKIDIDKTGIKRIGDYKVNWGDGFKYTGSVDIDSEVASKFGVEWRDKYPTNENDNIKAVASLLDTSAWSSFLTSDLAEKGALAIGSPTLEMWVSSWNLTHPDSKLYCPYDENGYRLGFTEETSDYSVGAIGSHDSSESLYFPHLIRL